MKSTSIIYGWASGGLSGVKVGLSPALSQIGIFAKQGQIMLLELGNLDLLSYHHVLLVQCAHEKYRSRRHPYNKLTWVLCLYPPFSVFMIAPPILNPTFSLILLFGKNGFKRRTPGCVFERQRHKRIIKVSQPHNNLVAHLGC